MAMPLLKAAEQSSSQPGVETAPPPGPASTQPQQPTNNGQASGIKEPPRNSSKFFPSSLADIKARMDQAESAQRPHKAVVPLKSLINPNADMKVDRDEVSLDGLRGLHVEVRNNTDRTLIFHGNQAEVVISGKTIACVSQADLEKIMNPMLSGKHRLKSDFVHSAVALATIGSVSTAKGIVQQSEPALDRYGKDEQRRIESVTRFSDRIVWPGESTKGIIYFDIDQPLTGVAIQMPVSSLYDTSDQASIFNTR